MATRKPVRAEERRRAAEVLLDPRVIRELAEAVPGFDRAGLLGSLIECWGGQDALASSIVLEFQRAHEGSMVRQRILDMILRLISQHSNDEAIVAVGDMDDATLRRQILAIVPALEAMEGGGVSVGVAPPPTFAPPPTLLPPGGADGRDPAA